MNASPGFAFSVIGINHGHIYGQVQVMQAAGCRLKAFFAPEDNLAAEFSKAFPGATRISDERAILDDREIKLVVGAGILNERAPMAVRAMRAGKDVMLDKPGATSLDQLAELRRAQKETGRIFSICYSEHYTQPATVAAGELVKSGAIGRVISTVGLGPHRIGNYRRPDWFYQRARYGGILCDIGSHQVEQFLFFTGSTKAEVLSSQIANFDHPDAPELEDFGQMVLASDHAAGYIRVDWFTPTSCPPGATAACSWSAPRARSSCANMSMSPVRLAPTICSWSTATASATRTAPRRRSSMAKSCATTSTTAPRPPCRWSTASTPPS
jgi:predicted dehydrogenase